MVPVIVPRSVCAQTAMAQSNTAITRNFMERISCQGTLTGQTCKRPNTISKNACDVKVVRLDLARGKTVSYLYEDHRLLQRADRPAGRVPAHGSCRTGTGVRRRASRSWRLPAGPARGY